VVAIIPLRVVPYVVTVYSICVFVYQHVPTDAYVSSQHTLALIHSMERITQTRRVISQSRLFRL